jgi:hypothetical protein
MLIKINGKEYETNNMEPAQVRMIQQLNLIENLGEVLNYAHDAVNGMLSQQFPKEEN